MSATKEEAPGGQTGGPVRSRQSADNGPVISSIVPDHDAIARYLRAVYGTENKGFALVATGVEPHYKGENYTHRKWQEKAYRWPEDREQIIQRFTQATKSGNDSYICPYLRDEKNRSQERSSPVELKLVHADVDTPIGADTVRALGAFAISSGSSGHGHVYVELTRPVTEHEHRALCRALGESLGATDPKISPNDMLRPPGTGNHKARARDGSSPTPVEWLVEPSETVKPEALAQRLDIDLEAEAEAEAKHSTTRGEHVEPEPVDFESLPQKLQDQFHTGGGDRSRAFYGLVAACADYGLTQGQTLSLMQEWQPGTDKYEGRLDEQVAECWAKVGIENDPKNVFDDLEPEDDSETEFWQARESLEWVRTLAMSRGVDPYAALGNVLARVAAATPCEYVLPAILGGRASLNSIFAITGGSGHGKGAASSAVDELFTISPTTPFMFGGTGSGEGITATYLGKKPDPDNPKRPYPYRVQVRRSVLFRASEGEEYKKLAGRKGATIMPVLRQLWEGVNPGFHNNDPDTTTGLRDKHYRFSVVIDVQPEHADMFLGDTSGTVQRIVWLPAEGGPKSREEKLAEPEPMRWDTLQDNYAIAAHDLFPPIITEWHEIPVCEAARFEIEENNFAMKRGETDLRDGHALLARLKVAALLGLLESREHVEVTEEDWSLAGHIMDVSTAERKRLERYLIEQENRAREAEGRFKARENVALSESVEMVQEEKTKTCQSKIIEKLSKADDKTLSHSTIRTRLSRPQRPYFDDAIAALIENGAVRTEPGDSTGPSAGVLYVLT